MKRQDLLKLLEVASVALGAEKDGVPTIFTNFCVTQKSILTFNDVIGVRLANPGLDFVGTLPGKLAIKFLKSCNDEEISFVHLPKDDCWRLRCGSTKLDFVTESPDNFPFSFPGAEHILTLEDEFFEGLELCAAVITDKDLVVPWLGGVACGFHDGWIDLSAINGSRDSIHAYKINGVEKLPLDKLILPYAFCRAAISMRKVLVEGDATLGIAEQFAVITFGEWNAIFGRTIDPEGAVDVIAQAKNLYNGIDFVPITNEVSEMIKRASMITGSSADPDCSFSIDDNGKVLLRTRTFNGTIRDTVTLQEPHPAIQVKINPRHVALKMEHCLEFGIDERVIVMRSQDGIFQKINANRM